MINVILQSSFIGVDQSWWYIKPKLRLYIVHVCAIMTCGVEACCIDEDVCRVMNGVNSLMVSTITGWTPHEETNPQIHRYTHYTHSTWYNPSALGVCSDVIGSYPSHATEPGRDRVTHKKYPMPLNPKKGDLLVDDPKFTSWRELQLHTYVCGQTTERNEG